MGIAMCRTASERMPWNNQNSLFQTNRRTNADQQRANAPRTTSTTAAFFLASASLASLTSASLAAALSSASFFSCLDAIGWNEDGRDGRQRRRLREIFAVLAGAALLSTVLQACRHHFS